MASKGQKIEFDEILDFDSDIEKIQTAPDMYISYSNNEGALHLAKECINNAVDELISPKSIGDTITLYLDEIENKLICTDNGRGIEFDKLEIICTKLQSGAKFTRDGVGSSAGQNGVGNTAINALSSLYQIVTRHNGKEGKITFQEGKKVEDLTIYDIKDKKEHGTTFIFKPSEKYLGKPCTIESDKLVEWLELLTYELPTNIEITLSIRKRGKEAESIKKFKNKNGMYDLVKKHLENPFMEPIHLAGSTKVMELVGSKEVERFVGVEFAFSFDRVSLEHSWAFCNFIHNVDGGIHLDSVKNTIANYFVKKTRDSLTEKESKDLEIIQKDVTDELLLAVYLNTNYRPKFSGQTKEKLGNRELYDPIKKITLEQLDKYMNLNPKLCKSIVGFIKTNAKARLAVNKAKRSVIKGETKPIDDKRIKGLVTCNNRGKEYKEIFLVEGDSARGTCEKCRDTDTQALFSLKGVPLNTYGKTVDKIVLNEEIKNMVRAFGCNIGQNFDLKKLKYKKIIILTDSDIDGHRISSLLCTFFLLHLPQIIEAGLLFRALPPLYKVKDGKVESFILDKSELIDLSEKNIRRHMDILDMNGKVLSHNETKDLLFRNRQYQSEIIRVNNRFDIHPELVEFIARYRKEKDFEKLLNKRFPEITIDEDGVLNGIHEGRFQTIILDDLFFHQLKEIERFIFDVNNGVIDYQILEKNSKKPIKYTLFQFFQMTAKYEPNIIKRFKGLGELEANELWETTLNPNTRTLVRMTMNDVEEEVRKFGVLHGEDSELRKAMMDGFRISREDLDN